MPIVLAILGAALTIFTVFLAPASAATTTCTSPVEHPTAARIFTTLLSELSGKTPLTLTTNSGFIPSSTTSPRGRYQARFDGESGCFAYIGFQDYTSTENSLCRINDELIAPTLTTADLTKASPYASAGYVYKDRGGEYENTVSMLDQYQIGTLVYCPAHATAFAASAVTAAQAAITKITSIVVPSDTKSTPYAEAVLHLLTTGVVSGYPDGTFKPSATINRAEFTKITLTAAGKVGAAADCFPDVPADAWFSPYVCGAKNLGIIGGYPDGTFKPNATINLAEALKISLTAFGVPTPAAPAGTPWYAPLIATAKTKDLYLTSFTTPSSPITRGEFAEVAYRLMTGTPSALRLPFLALSPAVDGTTTTIHALPARITGRAPAGTSITVNGGYTLTSCCTTQTTDSEWSYGLSTAYGNIAVGENTYTFTATDSSGKAIGVSTVTIIYEPQ